MRLTICVLLVFVLTAVLPALFGKKIAAWIPFVVGLLGFSYHFLYREDTSFLKMIFSWGSPVHYIHALVIVIAVLGLTLAIGWLAGNLSPRKTMTSVDWLKLLVNIPISALIMGIIAVFTEELFFRGVVQKELHDVFTPYYAVVLAALIFGLWHVPFGIIYNLKIEQVVLYAVGTFLVGCIFGGLYYKSQSLLVAGLAHGLWNAIVYTFYGLGSEMKGVLVVKNETISHPEYGLIGVIVLTVVVMSYPLFSIFK